MARLYQLSFCLCLAALGTSSGPGRSDEPKKEPEKKADDRAWLESISRALDVAGKIGEMEARKKAAENLRQLQLGVLRLQNDVRRDAPKKPGEPDLSHLRLLPLIEPDQLFRSYVSGSTDRLGAPLERVGPGLASQLKLPKDQGRVVGEVKKGSTAEKAGLKQHDILLEINGKPVPASDDDLGKLLPDGKDAKVSVTVLRGGEKLEIKKVPVAEKNDGTSNTIFLGEPLNLRAWEWQELTRRIQPGTDLPRGYEIISREPVLTTLFRQENRFTARLQEGTLAITVVGTTEGKKTTVDVIKVQEGSGTDRYTALDKVPVEYRDKATRLLKIGEKSEK